MKQFGSDKKPEEISFQIKPSRAIFRALGDCPGGLFVDLAAVAEAETTGDKVKVINSFFEAVLTEDSWVKWQERFNTGAKKDVIGLNDALAVFEWLVEQYAGDDLPTEGV